MSIPELHEVGAIERPWSIGSFRLPEDPRRHIVLCSIDATGRYDFFGKLKRAVASAEAAETAREAFVFVHGYNVSFEDAAYRTAQMAFDLEFNGPAIMFSWPSQARTEAYLADVDIATVMPGPSRSSSRVSPRSRAQRKSI